MKNLKIIILFLILIHQVWSQKIKLEKIEPPNWWIGMKSNQIQLMLYGENLSQFHAQFDTDKIGIKKIHTLKNDTYAFLDIKIETECLPGDYYLTLKKNNIETKLKFEVLERENNKNQHSGFGEKDIIYLITPDRFANGDYSNDNIKGMRDHADRSDILRRHGGDIQGIINNLDYIQKLGFTAIWINPLIENDMDISYHGYAATNLYNIDPRFGSNHLYKTMVEKAHTKGIKIILDHVSNHVGMYHPWVANPPTSDWFHGTMENHLYAIHDKRILIDQYVDSTLVKKMKNGWFVTEMPDLNQANAFLSNYLIQNTIWWIESFGIDGIREDTYPYVNQQFLSNWAKVIFEEYPNLNIVGEVWINDPVFIAPFQTKSFVNNDIETYLPSVTDFALMESIGKVIQGKESIYHLYECVSRDYLYSYPKKLVTFLDNHDVMRLWDLSAGNVNKYKMALVLLFTLRGIPQVYYGTEIGLPGGDDHGLIRRDMPGGFAGDDTDVFRLQNLNEKQSIIFQFLKNLIEVRKNNNSLSEGRLIHFSPHNEIYFFIRENEDEKILIIVNNNDSKQKFYISEIPLLREKDYQLFDLLKKSLKVQEKQYVELEEYEACILKIM